MAVLYCLHKGHPCSSCTFPCSSQNQSFSSQVKDFGRKIVEIGWESFVDNLENWVDGWKKYDDNLKNWVDDWNFGSGLDDLTLSGHYCFGSMRNSDDFSYQDCTLVCKDYYWALKRPHSSVQKIVAKLVTLDTPQTHDSCLVIKLKLTYRKCRISEFLIGSVKYLILPL